jgi:hypothetical protein
VLDLGLTFADGTRQVKTVEVGGKSETFTIPLDTAPVAVALDPDVWLLAEMEIVRR